MPADTATTPRDQIRKKPLPLEFPGVHHMNEEEIEAAVRLLRSRSLFRYYGVDLQHEVDQFEAEFARFIGARHAVAVSSGTMRLRPRSPPWAWVPGRK